MNTVRIMAAVLFGMLAALLVCGQVGVILGRHQIHVLQDLVAFATAASLGASCFFFARPAAYWAAKLSCPRCGHTDSLKLSAFPQPRISVFAWILGGVVVAALYRAARKHRYHCDSCQEDCSLRAWSGWLAILWLGLLIIGLIALGIDEATANKEAR